LTDPTIRKFMSCMSQGQFLMQMGRHEMAEKAFQEAVKLIPENGDAHESLGIALKEQDKLDEAVQECDLSAKYSPKSASVWFNRGLTLYMRTIRERQVGCGSSDQHQQDRQASHDSFRRALELDEMHYQARNMLAEYLRLEGKLEEAKKEFERSLEIEPESGVALMALTQIYLDQGDPIRAMAYADKGIRFYPDNPGQKRMAMKVLEALKQRGLA
jgi:tetratricopeptide (TPR) repeat protein